MKLRSVLVSGAVTALIFAIINIGLWAGEGGLTTTGIERIRTAFEMDGHTRAMYNAITNTDINNLVLNRDIIRGHNDLFSHKLKVKGVTNQKGSGRCWLFAGLNVLRPKVIEKYSLGSFEFSQNYLSFWDKLEKSNSFLEYMIELRGRTIDDRELEILIRDPIGDGGWWQYVVALIEKYGVVPKNIMPETNSSENTGAMNGTLVTLLRADAARIRRLHGEGKTPAELRAVKDEMLTDIYRLLVINLGEPPREFPYRFEGKDSTLSPLRTYTPQSFYKEFVGIDLGQYVSIFNNPTKEYGRHYSMRYSKNMYDYSELHYANIPMEQLKEIAQKSLLADEPVWFACEIGKDQSRDRGIMAVGLYDYGPIYDLDMGMTKAERTIFRETTTNHAMVLVGVDIQDKKAVKWMVENSWGSENKSGGYWTMYDDWFEEYVYNIIVKKDFVPEEVLRIYEQPVIVLPPWDPMFSVVR